MAGTNRESGFGGQIPLIYDRLLVPMIFASAASRTAAAIASLQPRDIVETAAGTGVLTRAMTHSCPDASIVATDLSQQMLDVAATRGDDSARVSYLQSDALDLPFEPGSFDVVTCQFGAMFFPDRARGFGEARRVLRPRGSFVFTVWDSIEENVVPRIIETALQKAAPKCALTFMSQLPHGYCSPSQIRADLSAAGWGCVAITSVEEVSRGTVKDAAVAFCQGTPLRLQIEQCVSFNIDDATAIAENALIQQFGPGAFEAPIRYLEVVASPKAVAWV